MYHNSHLTHLVRFLLRVIASHNIQLTSTETEELVCIYDEFQQLTLTNEEFCPAFKN